MAKIPIGSDIERRKWIKAGVVNRAYNSSFWTSFTGKSFAEPIYMQQDRKQDDGHTVVFQLRGTASSRAIKGDERAYGTGQVKRIFSDKVMISRFRQALKNGTKFDAANEGDLSLALHSDARTALADVHVRWKDQCIFDVLQGVAGSAPSHRVSFGTGTFTYDALLDLEQAVKMGTFNESTANTSIASTWSQRAPLDPISMKGRAPMYLLVGDSAAVNALKRNRDFREIAYNADLRGKDKNMLLTGVIGTLGNFMIMEADTFHGKNLVDASGTVFLGQEDFEVERCGVRTFKANSTGDDSLPAPLAWKGNSNYNTVAANETWTRAMIVGNGAAQVAVGMEPEYHWQKSDDFGINSESAIETWMGFRKTQLKLEQGVAYDSGVSGIDYGVIAVDIRIS